jgi:hypothetical protein
MSAMGNAHALVIGIANYQHINPLPPTVLKDAQDINKILIDPQRCGYIPKNVGMLLDGSATKDAIIKALTDLADRSNSDSILFFYISSHGGRIETGRYAGEYLLPVDASFESEKMLAKTSISGAEFSDALQAIPARKVIVVFDCCHAGGIKDAGPVVIKRGLPESYYARLQAGRGRAVLASSRSTESSYVLPGAENSLFTQHLLEGLRGGIASEDGLIRIFDLFEYIQPRVTGDQPAQHPIFRAELEENFPVALYLGGKKGVVRKVKEDFRYDAYISYVDKEPDSEWVWGTLVPRLENEGLKVAVSGDVEEPGVARVVSIERGIRQSKRTLVVLSDSYLDDKMAEFVDVLSQTMGIQEGTYRLLPVTFTNMEVGRLPATLSSLVTVNLNHPRRAEREWDRLVKALQSPLPKRG